MTNEINEALRTLFAELTDGAHERGGAYILNTGDVGLLKSLEKLSARDASHAVDDGATIAAHTQHLRYGLSLMNRWTIEGGNPFADAKWDEAWTLTAVNDAEWRDIQRGLEEEVRRWAEQLAAPRDVTQTELNGMVGSVAHLAYHLGAIRQIARGARGPREGTFV